MIFYFYNELDIRDLSIIERKKFLEKFFLSISENKYFDLSKIIKFSDFKVLNNIYLNCSESNFIEGLMLKKKTVVILQEEKKTIG